MSNKKFAQRKYMIAGTRLGENSVYLVRQPIAVLKAEKLLEPSKF